MHKKPVKYLIKNVHILNEGYLKYANFIKIILFKVS